MNPNNNQAQDSDFSLESSDLQFHLSVIQNTIQRMANNSSSCKTWCITLASAILVMSVDKEESSYILITLLPIIVFAFLDAYYLSLERMFRGYYKCFIENFYDGRLSIKHLYFSDLSRKSNTYFFSACKSPSILGFYIPLIILTLVIKLVVIGL